MDIYATDGTKREQLFYDKEGSYSSCAGEERADSFFQANGKRIIEAGKRT